jgi:hypothetical protein
MASLLQYSRLFFAATVLSSVEFGKWLLFGIFRGRIDPCSGIYIPMTAVTLYLMFRRPITSPSQYIMLAYIFLSLANNIIGYSTSTIYQEAAVVEQMADVPVQNTLNYCSPVSVASALSANFQVLASDLLMVRLMMGSVGSIFLTLL